MNSSGRGRASRWLDRAREDLEAARLVWTEGGLLRTALYHSQQAAEKALKAVIASGGMTPPRTHDLSTLLDLCAPDRPSLEDLRDDAVLLTEYAVEPRYPGDHREYGEEEAKSALDAAERLLDACSEVLDDDD